MPFGYKMDAVWMFLDGVDITDGCCLDANPNGIHSASKRHNVRPFGCKIFFFLNSFSLDVYYFLETGYYTIFLIAVAT